MFLSAPDDVLLRRVTLQGQSSDIAAASTSLKTALEHCPWPTTAPGEILLLRRIRASGNLREIAIRAAQQAQRFSESAIDGWSPAAPHSLAVRFSGQASLLACLIRDLLQGNARNLWYWQRWANLLQGSPADAIIRLVESAPLQLPAVVTQLHTTPVWLAFWLTLGDRGADQLLDIVAQATSWVETLRAARTLLADGIKASSAAAPNEQGVAPADWTTTCIDLHFLPASLRLILGDSRLLLAALFIVWQKAPTLLQQPDGAEQLIALAQRLGDHTEEISKFQSITDTIYNKYQFKKADPGPTSAVPTGIVDLQPPVQPKTPGNVEFCASSEHFSPVNPIRPAWETDTSQAELTANSEQATTKSGDNRALNTRDYESFLGLNIVTHQGGIFFLLNFLNLKQAKIGLPTNLPGAGWRWLADLATEIGCGPEGPLLWLFAKECGLEIPGDAADWTPILDVAPLARLGAKRYGDEVWRTDIWRIPARLIATASHLDIHFHLNDANLAVRRAGLDLNPGWLPWLGRVVNFHFGSGLEPTK